MGEVNQESKSQMVLQLETNLDHILELSWMFQTKMIQQLVELQCGWSFLGVVL